MHVIREMEGGAQTADIISLSVMLRGSRDVTRDSVYRFSPQTPFRAEDERPGCQ